MSTEVTTTGTRADATGTTPTSPPAPPAPEAPATEPDVLPEFDEEKFRESLNKKNQENRSLRQRLREMEPEVTQLRSAVEGLTTRAQDSETELRRLRAALGAGVPTEHASDIAGRLRGETDAELEADAKRLVALMRLDIPELRHDPAQGKGGSMPLNGDPILDAVKDKLGIQ